MLFLNFSSRAARSRTAFCCGLLGLLAVAGCSKDPAVTTTAATAKASAASAPGTPAPGTAAGAVAGSAVKAAPGASVAAEGKAASGRRDSRQAMDSVPVETALISRGPISAFLSFNSVLETESVVDIFPQTTGQVEALLVEEGRIVKEGEPLLKIEDRELRVDAEETTANYEHLKKNFARTQDLFERNLINKQDYENQAYTLEQARLRLERAKIRLAYATVRAPFAGVISAREVQVGARVASGTKLFSMVKLDDIVARVFVPGRYLPMVAEKQEAIVTSEFLPDRSFKGWVKRISPVIDPKSGTFKVTVGVHSEKPKDLPPGLFVNVRVITDTRDSAVLLPKRAVVYEGGERYVFVVSNGQAVKKKLVGGYEDTTNIEAVSGLEVGTPVIVLGQNGLKDRANVRVVNALAPIPQPPVDGESAEPAAEAKTPPPATAAAAAEKPSKT